MSRFYLPTAMVGALILTGCVATTTTETAETKTDNKAPARMMTALPVVEYAGNQADLLASSDPKLAANKKIAYDFFRIILRGRRLDQADQYMHEDYMQHNPNADTGMAGFKAYFSALGGPLDIPERLPGLVAVQAEGDYVTLSFVREYQDPNIEGATYYTTWFDMFRVVDGKIAEHWDSATKGPNPTPAQKG